MFSIPNIINEYDTVVNTCLYSGSDPGQWDNLVSNADPGFNPVRWPVHFNSNDTNEWNR